MFLACLGVAGIGFAIISTMSTWKGLLLTAVIVFTAWLAFDYVGKITSPTCHPPFNITGPVPGRLDEVSSLQKKRLAREIGLFIVEEGEDLMLRGWLASTLDEPNPPRVLLMESDGTTPVGIPFQVQSENRYDVAVFLKNILMDQCGFKAIMHIPETMPAGRYQIRVERNKGQDRQYYDPDMQIQITEKSKPDPVVKTYSGGKETRDASALPRRDTRALKSN